MAIRLKRKDFMTPLVKPEDGARVLLIVDHTHELQVAKFNRKQNRYFTEDASYDGQIGGNVMGWCSFPRLV